MLAAHGGAPPVTLIFPPDGLEPIELVGGIPFMSDADLEAAMKEAGQSDDITQAALEFIADQTEAG